MEDKFVDVYDELVNLSSKIDTLMGNMCIALKDNPDMVEIMSGLSLIGMMTYDARETFIENFCPNNDMKEALKNNAEAHAVALRESIDKLKASQK